MDSIAQKDPATLYESICRLPTASDHIRLLHVRPSLDTSAPIQCDIQVCHIQNLPSYVALSYTWGKEGATKSMSAWAVDHGSSSTSIGPVFIKITPALETCLIHLRPQTEQLVIWIDQLCIDQRKESTEKVSQILLMDIIYKSAERVIAWVGPAADGSDVLMDKWSDYGKDAQKLGIERFLSADGLGDLAAMTMPTVDLAESVPNSEDSQQLKALLTRAQGQFEGLLDDALKFYVRPWFRRMWIVQEVALASDVVIQCGDKSGSLYHIYWGMVVSKFAWIYASFQLRDKGMKAFSQMAKLKEAGEPLSRLIGCRQKAQWQLNQSSSSEEHGMPMLNYLEFLNVSYRMDATDHRDRIFGILKLPADSADLDIRPDYTSSVELVYTRAARKILTRGNGKKGPTVEILRNCQTVGLEVSKDLPSWVPNWQKALRPSFYSSRQLNHDHGPLFHAGGPKGTMPELVDTDPADEQLIGFRGYRIDEIKEVKMPWYGPPREQELLHDGGAHVHDALRRRNAVILAFLQDTKALCTKAVERDRNRNQLNLAVATTEPPPFDLPSTVTATAFWRVPCADLATTTRGGFVERATSSQLKEAYDASIEGLEFQLEQDERRFDEYWKPLLNGRSENEKKRLFQLASNYMQGMLRTVHMRPFLTTEGYVGMAPATAEAGDVVVVLQGGQAPFVVRDTGTGTGKGKGKYYRYRLLGEAYCHGIMDGEALLPRQMSLTDIFFI